VKPQQFTHTAAHADGSALQRTARQQLASRRSNARSERRRRSGALRPEHDTASVSMDRVQGRRLIEEDKDSDERAVELRHATAAAHPKGPAVRSWSAPIQASYFWHNVENSRVTYPEGL